MQLVTENNVIPHMNHARETSVQLCCVDYKTTIATDIMNESDIINE